MQLTGLAKRLVTAGLATAEYLHDVQKQAVVQKIPFITYLIQHTPLHTAQVFLLIAQEFSLPFFDLSTVQPDHLPVQLISKQFIRNNRIIPLMQKGQHLLLALADPTKQALFDEIKFHTGLIPLWVIVEENKLNKLLTIILNTQELSDFENILPSEISSANLPLLNDEIDDAPVVRYVHKILMEAINKGASDIHFEPYEKNYRIRFRIDGVLSERVTPPANFSQKITARIKILAQLDIAERRIPQDGRFKITTDSKQTIDFRVSTCPTLYGEKIVVRILTSAFSLLDINLLGFDKIQQQLFATQIHKPQGMILVTGPTGSGKTISLYSALTLLNHEQVNIVTIEDPIEINLPGINQVNINPKAGLDFATALRSFLRQDPDIIMVGEIRDLETAEISLKAAQTGHLVLSTVHTNSAAETLTRLLNMGVKRYSLASSLSLVIAQRLARKLCDYCKREQQLPLATLVQEGFTQTDLVDLKLYGPGGCDECVDGYKNRLGIFEVLPISETISQLILQGASAFAINQQAKNAGMTTLREAGLAKIKAGLTSLAEINRITW